MKTYSEKSGHWKNVKTVEFLLNFLSNHQGEIEDNDTFTGLADLKSHEEWIKMIRATFSATMIERLQNFAGRRDCLDFNDESKEIFREIWNAEFARSKFRKMLLAAGKEYLAAHPLKNYAGERFPLRTKELQNTLKISDFELDVLLVIAFGAYSLLEMSDGHHHRSDESDKAVFIAKCLNRDVDEVLAALEEKGKLRRFGCVDEDFDFSRAIGRFLSGSSDEPFASQYFQKIEDEVLPWDFYGKLAEKHGVLLKRILSGDHPANILLYGAPGTGKTSFAQTLAHELHRDCYLIAQDTKNSTGRFGAVQVCDMQVDASSSIILVDEADEMLRSNCLGGFFTLFNSSAPTGDKGMLNSVLDDIHTPTIWITNTPAEALDESSRRRFDYSIRFDPLSAEQRLSIWRNNIAKMKLGKLFDDNKLKMFSERYAVSAGGITLTLQNLARLKPEPEEVESLVDQLMAPHCELLQVPREVEKMQPAKDYSLDGLNIKGAVKLPRIIEAVRNFQSGKKGGIDRPRMNLLLSGAPGTGKTEFVKYLGSVLQTKVVVKMGSDLLNMYVGGTEQRIKQAFAEAEAEKAILFLDEIDGLVQSRDRAQRSWEVTQVNELLYQMENFNGVMIGATNFLANLDPAILRRFTFKLEFDYLDEAGKMLFFERMFETKLTPAEAARLTAIPRLTPGDFRTVRQSLFYLDDGADNNVRLAELERESAAKSIDRAASGKHSIGF